MVRDAQPPRAAAGAPDGVRAPKPQDRQHLHPAERPRSGLRREGRGDSGRAVAAEPVDLPVEVGTMTLTNRVVGVEDTASGEPTLCFPTVTGARPCLVTGAEAGHAGEPPVPDFALVREGPSADIGARVRGLRSAGASAVGLVLSVTEERYRKDPAACGFDFVAVPSQAGPGTSRVRGSPMRSAMEAAFRCCCCRRRKCRATSSTLSYSRGVSTCTHFGRYPRRPVPRSRIRREIRSSFSSVRRCNPAGVPVRVGTHADTA